MANSPLNILLTNDDGYNAPGITTLYDALVAAGYNVHIVAPAVNQSAQGSTLGGAAALSSPISYTEFSPGNFAVSGSPVVVAKTAIEDIYPNILHLPTPDLIISGTNAGDNTGESANISGTVNGALAGLFDGVPAIAVSAGSANGSYTAGFTNAASVVVDLVQKLDAMHTDGTPLLPDGQGISINVPGLATPNGLAVTTIDSVSSAYYPIGELANGQYNSTYVPNTTGSADPLSEGGQFLKGYVTYSPIDGNWSSTEGNRILLQDRLDGLLHSTTPVTNDHPLNIMLVNDDGYAAPGLAAMRDALLAAGDTVTVVAPANDQSGIGTALTLQNFNVTHYEAGYIVGATPTTTVYTGLDALLTGENHPDLIVSGANAGANVGIATVSSGTVSAAVASVFNYDVPAIAVSTGTDSTGKVPAGLYDTSAAFVVKLIDSLQATEGSDGHLLPDHTGLSVNVPVGADLSNYAFTTLDQASNLALHVVAGSTDGQAQISVGAGATSGDPASEGANFNAGKITITPIDGNYASTDVDFYHELANLLGAKLGNPAPFPGTDGHGTTGPDVTANDLLAGLQQLTPLLNADAATGSHSAADFVASALQQAGGSLGYIAKAAGYGDLYASLTSAPVLGQIEDAFLHPTAATQSLATAIEHLLGGDALQAPSAASLQAFADLVGGSNDVPHLTEQVALQAGHLAELSAALNGIGGVFG